MSIDRVYTATIIGGGSAGNLSLKALRASPRFRTLAVADVRESARTQIATDYPGVRTFATHDEMFRACPADVVCVATYPPSHAPLTLAALAAQPLRGLLVEKPLADTTAAASELLAAIKVRRLPVAVPHGLLVSPHALDILRRVHAGEIGALQLVDIRNRQWDLLSAGIHWLNFCVRLLGPDPVVSALAACDTSTRTYRDGVQAETEAVSYFQTKAGVRLVLHTGDTVDTGAPGKGLRFLLVGSAGTIEFWGWEANYRVTNAAHPAGELFSAPLTGRTRHQVHLENLAAQMDAGTTDYGVAESSLAALELVEAAYLSHRRRCLVRLPLATFTPPALTDWDAGRPYAGTGGGRDGRKLS